MQAEFNWNFLFLLIVLAVGALICALIHVDAKIDRARMRATQQRADEAERARDDAAASRKAKWDADQVARRTDAYNLACASMHPEIAQGRANLAAMELTVLTEDGADHRCASMEPFCGDGAKQRSREAINKAIDAARNSRSMEDHARRAYAEQQAAADKERGVL